jgi:RNA polymerase sigma-70 factor (ECF subfamily)
VPRPGFCLISHANHLGKPLAFSHFLLVRTPFVDKRPGGDGEVTVLLEQVRRGEAGALDRLGRVIYPELHRLARSRMRKEWVGHALQTTALVNEALVRLLEQNVLERSPNRHYLFAAAARAMRWILVDHGRRRQVEQRIGLRNSVVLDDILARMEADDAPILELNRAMEELERIHPRPARVVELRYFGGCTVDQIAEVLSIGRSTVESDFRVARAWLRARLKTFT